MLKQTKEEIIVELIEEHFETDTVINIGDWNELLIEAEKRVREQKGR